MIRSMIKVTFTLDKATVARLDQTAERLSKPKSEVVREAIADYHAKSDRLSEAERARLLRIVDELTAQPSTRGQAAVNREIREVRRVRRSGGRLHPSDERA